LEELHRVKGIATRVIGGGGSGASVRGLSCIVSALLLGAFGDGGRERRSSSELARSEPSISSTGEDGSEARSTARVGASSKEWGAPSS